MEITTTKEENKTEISYNGKLAFHSSAGKNYFNPTIMSEIIIDLIKRVEALEKL